MIGASTIKLFLHKFVVGSSKAKKQVQKLLKIILMLYNEKTFWQILFGIISQICRKIRKRFYSICPGSGAAMQTSILWSYARLSITLLYNDSKFLNWCLVNSARRNIGLKILKILENFRSNVCEYGSWVRIHKRSSS